MRGGKAFLALCLCLVAVGAGAGGNRDSIVRGVIQDHLNSRGIVGASVAVWENGEVVYSEGFGYADVEHAVPVTPDTVFRLASISKPITSTAVMQLVESGKVKLDESIRKYVPEFPDKGSTITVRQILSHTSGIRHYNAGEQENLEEYSSVRQSLDRFKNDPLWHKPGEKQTYSTYAYQLLARLVENVSKRPFRQYLADHVFYPAGMGHTRPEDRRQIVKNRAHGYLRDKNGILLNSEFSDISYKTAGGGLISTASDMCRFGAAVMNGRVVTRWGRDVMWTPQKLNSGAATDYGLGWGLRTMAKRPVIRHSGSQTGAKSLLVIVPEEQLVIAVLTNYETHDVMELGDRLLETWLSPVPDH